MPRMPRRSCKGLFGQRRSRLRAPAGTNEWPMRARAPPPPRQPAQGCWRRSPAADCGTRKYDYYESKYTEWVSRHSVGLCRCAARAAPQRRQRPRLARAKNRSDSDSIESVLKLPETATPDQPSRGDGPRRGNREETLVAHPGGRAGAFGASVALRAARIQTYFISYSRCPRGRTDEV